MSTDQRLRATKKWNRISREIKLDDNQVRKNIDKVILPQVAQFQNMNTEFWRDYITRVRSENLFPIISRYQTLDRQFIMDFRAELDWDLILRHQSVTDPYLPREQAPITSAMQDASEYILEIDKSKISISDFTELSTFDIKGSNIIANNNESYIIESILETDSSVFIRTSSPYDNSATRLGWIFFNNTGTGEIDPISFITDPLIKPFIHKGNNISRRYRDNLVIGQYLTEDFIINNHSSLNIKALSQHQKLYDFFIMNYDITSEFPNYNRLIPFDWDQLTINQNFREILENPDYSNWTSGKINKQLLLKYQNLKKDFILENIEQFQLPDIGRFNRNFSEQDLRDIQESNPFLTETTSREGSIKFNYNFSDIRKDLAEADFEFEEGSPVGYIFYDRNGKVNSSNEIKFNVIPGTEIRTLHVDLDEDNANSRSGITVNNGSIIVKKEDRQQYKIAKVKIPIVSRNIDSSSTGLITFAPKSIYSDTDRLIVPDGITKKVLEIDLDGSGITTNSNIYNKSNVTISESDNIVTCSNNHYLELGDPVRFIGVGLPSPILPNTTYYVIHVNSTQIRVATSVAAALNNIAIDITANGSGEIVRYDNKFNLESDIRIFNGLPFYFEDSGVNTLSPILRGQSNIYYIIKESDNTFRIATTEENAKSRIGESFTGNVDNEKLYTNTIPINLRSLDIIRSSEVSNVFKRALGNLYEVTLNDDASIFESDPYYPKLKNGNAEDISGFNDYSSTFTATANNNRISLVDTIPISNGDPISFTGSLPAPLNENTIYYAIKINNNEIEVAHTEDNAIHRISITLTSNGSGTIYPIRIDLLNDIGLNTGNRVEIQSASLPTGIESNIVYYVRKISNTRIELCSTLEDSFNGNPIIIKKTGNNSKTLIANDYNCINSNLNTNGIIHYTTGNTIYVEFPDQIFQVGEDITPRDVITSRTITSIKPILEIDTISSGDSVVIISNLPSTSKSDANILIERFSNNLNSFKVRGLVGGFEDTIIDDNARGIGCIIKENNTLRAFSVIMIDNDYFDKLRF
jgi:hypothetical protein